MRITTTIELQSLAHGENLSVRPLGYLQQIHQLYRFRDFELSFIKKSHAAQKIRSLNTFSRFVNL